MSDQIDEIKTAVRNFLQAECQPVQPKRETSRQVHLEVWMTKHRGRAIGLELKHPRRLNFWLLPMNVPANLSETAVVVRKQPKGRGWTDAADDGTNSNLSSYDEFRTKPIVRLGVSRLKDAQAVIAHLLR